MTPLPERFLSPETTNRVVAHLGIQPAAPSLGFLELLVGRYVRSVPWESASRIAKRARVVETENCPRWPEEFWDSAVTSGTGGTCFESNLAFFTLLQTLGFEGYLTVNDMHEYVGVHTAIIILLDSTKWLVDAGYPLYTPLYLDAAQVSSRSTSLLNYTVTPRGENRYDIERTPHPSPYTFTLIDTPVSHDDYCAATTRDYGENGLFLDRVVINKVVDEQMWRFNSGEKPYHFEQFLDGQRIDHAIDVDAASTVARHFGIDAQIVSEALHVLGEPE